MSRSTQSASPLLLVLPLNIFLALWSCPRVHAQSDVREEIEAKRAERQFEIEAAIREAARQAAARKALETKETVTYEQILADPDNLDLNFRYAQSQVGRGDLVGASATLERILMIDPNLSQIRLFYALVLYRLDSLEEAEREFRLLSEMTLPDAERNQVAQYLGEIRRRQRPTKLATTLTVGWGFDSNRNAAPSSKERLIFDTPVGLTGTTKKRRDTHFLILKSLDVAHDLGAQGGHQLIGSFSYFLGEQTVADDLDLQSFSLEGGGVIKTPLADITPTGFASYLYLSRETFLRSQGVQARANRPLGDRLTLSGAGSWTREDFVGITENTAAPERTGDRVNVEAGASFLLVPTMQVSGIVGYENKDIRGTSQFNAYEGFTLTGNHTWLLGKGQFLVSGLTFTVNGYDEPDTAISSRTRRDEQLRVRLTYGVPIPLLVGGWFPSAFIEDTTATFSVEQFRSLSNIPNYTYSNTKLDLMVSKRIDF